MKHLIYSPVLLCLLFVSCTNESDENESSPDQNEYADRFCECASNSEINLDFRGDFFEIEGDSYEERRKNEAEARDCMLPILKDLKEDIEDMSTNDKKAFTKSFLKGLIDTECGDRLLDNVPWSEMEEGVGHMIEEVEEEKEREEKMGDFDLDRICECFEVQFSGEGDPDCEAYLEEMERIYEDMDYNEKQEVEERIQECMENAMDMSIEEEMEDVNEEEEACGEGSCGEGSCGEGACAAGTCGEG